MYIVTDNMQRPSSSGEKDEKEDSGVPGAALRPCPRKLEKGRSLKSVPSKRASVVTIGGFDAAPPEEITYECIVLPSNKQASIPGSRAAQHAHKLEHLHHRQPAVGIAVFTTFGTLQHAV